MFKLFSCEWLRIKKVIAIALTVHIVLLALLIQFGLFNSDTIGFKMSLTLLYGGCGYLFGVTQMKTYTKSSQWAYLINRPINVKFIYLSLFMTALVAFLLVIILPFFMATFVLDYWQKEIIDLRHYQQLVYFLGIVISFYLAACFTVLINKKRAHLLFMVVLLPVISLNMGGSVYWLVFGVTICLFLMVITAVKVNLNNLSTGYIFQATTAMAYQYAIYFIIISSFFMLNEIVLNVVYRSQDSNQNSNQDSTKEKQLNSTSFREFISLKPQDAVVKGLFTQDQKYGDLIEEIKLSKTTRIRKRIWFHPTQQQLPFMDENKSVIVDSENKINWQFSHDLMLFVGKNTISKKLVGYLGPNNSYTQLKDTQQSDLFYSVPWVGFDQIVVKNKVYEYQNNKQSFRLIFTAKEDEYLLNGLQNHGSVQAIITTKRLYLFNRIDYDNDALPLQAQITVPLPGDYNNLWDVQITEVIDRFILSFLYGKSSRHDIYKAQHLSYEFTLSGQINQLNQRDLVQSPPLLIKDLDYMISPAWKWGLDHFPTHPSRDRYLSQRPQVQNLSNITYVSILVFAILCALLTLMLAKKQAVSKPIKWLWVILNTVIGLPGVLSFMLLYSKKVKLINHEINRELHHV